MTVAVEPSAAEILERLIALRGGREAIRGRTTLSYRGDIAVQKMNGVIDSVRKAPDKTYQRIDLGPVVQESGFDGEVAWVRDPRGARRLEGKERDRAAENALFWRFLAHEDPGSGITVHDAGRGSVEGRDAHVLELRFPSGHLYRSFLDPESLLELKAVSTASAGGQDFTREVYYGDYRDIGGSLAPFSIRQVTPFNETVIQVRAYGTCDDPDDALFRMP
jgi:hypothetical protein